MPPILSLPTLIGSGLAELKALRQAAASPLYQVGRDDYDALQLMADGAAVIDSRAESREIVGTHANVVEFPGNEREWTKRLAGVLEGHTGRCPKESIVIRGPLDAGVVLGVTEACRYLVTQGRHYSRGLGAVKKLLVHCDLPSLGRNDDRQTVLSADSETSPFSIGFYGSFPDGLHFHLAVMTNLDPLGGVLGHPNDFRFATTRRLDRPGQWRSDQGEGIHDVHLNGPEINPMMRDLIRLGESIRQYLLGQI